MKPTCDQTNSNYDSVEAKADYCSLGWQPKDIDFISGHEMFSHFLSHVLFPFVMLSDFLQNQLLHSMLTVLVSLLKYHNNTPF